MTTTSKLTTAEELLAMGNKQLELHEGGLRIMSPANSRHGDIAAQISMLLRQFAHPRKLGRVITEGGFVLARNPDTVLGPDVSFVRQDRIPAGGLPQKFFEGSPDLAVEIISPTNPRRELLAKLKAYLEHGTTLAWLVDPHAERVEIFCPNHPVQQLAKTDTITAQDLLPCFSSLVADFFA